ncbi:hypothetical protein NDU88_007163 [Pleurodeles waltl]|uniref:RRM domain-containing protein n=1 Tax=Pleurodeles waltl TaxID=8319 RepID=A0AAV7RPH9_PLEWA|nr:hypothetical protein NDU88_007163 [Pleurodeles waltl]
MSRYGGRYQGETKVYVGNLSTGAGKGELERAFSYYGPLRTVWIARNPPGFAFVEFEDPRDAEDAVRGLDGNVICGSRLRVELSTDAMNVEKKATMPMTVIVTVPAIEGAGLGHDLVQDQEGDILVHAAGALEGEHGLSLAGPDLYLFAGLDHHAGLDQILVDLGQSEGQDRDQDTDPGHAVKAAGQSPGQLPQGEVVHHREVLQGVPLQKTMTKIVYEHKFGRKLFCLH